MCIQKACRKISYKIAEIRVYPYRSTERVSHKLLRFNPKGREHLRLAEETLCLAAQSFLNPIAPYGFSHALEAARREIAHEVSLAHMRVNREQGSGRSIVDGGRE